MKPGNCCPDHSQPQVTALEMQFVIMWLEHAGSGKGSFSRGNFIDRKQRQSETGKERSPPRTCPNSSLPLPGPATSNSFNEDQSFHTWGLKTIIFRLTSATLVRACAGTCMCVLEGKVAVCVLEGKVAM